MKLSTFAPWIVLIVALLAWAGVAMFVSAVTNGKTERIAHLKVAQQSSVDQEVRIRARALARETVSERSELDNFLAVDLGSVADMIESAGKASGVSVTLGDAVPEAAGPSGAQLRGVGFVIDAQGTFAELMHLVELFQTLPIPSTVTRFDIERVSSGSAGTSAQWHMNANIRVLTTSDFSS